MKKNKFFFVVGYSDWGGYFVSDVPITNVPFIE